MNTRNAVLPPFSGFEIKVYFLRFERSERVGNSLLNRHHIVSESISPDRTLLLENGL